MCPPLTSISAYPAPRLPPNLTSADCPSNLVFKTMSDRIYRYFDKWRGTREYSPAMDAVASALAAVTSTPTAVASGASAAAVAAAHRRRSLSTEDVSSLDATDVTVSDADTSTAAASSNAAAGRNSSKRISGSPHPQVQNYSYSGTQI